MNAQPPTNIAQMYAAERKVKISSSEQLKRLINFMVANPDIGCGVRAKGKSRALLSKQWKNFAKELNLIGPPTRTPDEWKRVWINYKGNLQRKLSKRSTEGDPFVEVTLSPLEESVMHTFFPEKFMNTSNTTTERLDNSPSTSKSQEIALPYVVKNEWECAVENEAYCVEAENETHSEAESDMDTEEAHESHTSTKKDTQTAHVNAKPTPEFNPMNNNSINNFRSMMLQQQANTQTEILETLRRMECIMEKNYKLNEKLYELKLKKAEVIMEQKKVKMALAKAKLAKLKSEI